MPIVFVRLLFAFCIILPTLSLCHAQSDDSGVLTLYYYERPPFHYSNAEGVEGFIAEQAEDTLRQAGIPFRWQLLPVKRILNDLYITQDRVCSPGWYFAAERQARARFSEPMMADPPLASLVNKQALKHIRSTAEETLATTPIRVVKKGGFVAGQYLDKLLAAVPQDRMFETTSEVGSMVLFLMAARADITFMPEREADYYRRTTPGAKETLELVRFKDIPKGESRYFICSKAVDPELLNRINRALKKTYH